MRNLIAEVYPQDLDSLPPLQKTTGSIWHGISPEKQTNNNKIHTFLQGLLLHLPSWHHKAGQRTATATQPCLCQPSCCRAFSQHQGMKEDESL